MQIADFSTPTSEGKGSSIFFLGSPFRSRWFFWRTFEFLLVLGTNVFVLIKYWSRLTGHQANILILVVGFFMLVVPYRSLVRTCRELQELCRKAETWDGEHKSLLVAIVAVTQEEMGYGISRYFTTVWTLLVLITYCIIRRP
jgi:hypothetical protein